MPPADSDEEPVSQGLEQEVAVKYKRLPAIGQPARFAIVPHRAGIAQGRRVCSGLTDMRHYAYACVRDFETPATVPIKPPGDGPPSNRLRVDATWTGCAAKQKVLRCGADAGASERKKKSHTSMENLLD